MAILRDISGVTSGSPEYNYSTSANNTGDITDFLRGIASNSSFSNESLFYKQIDDSGNPISGPQFVERQKVPGTDPSTGAIFDNSYNTFALGDDSHAVFYTHPSTSNYNLNDATSLGFAEYDDAGNLVQGPQTLDLNGQYGVKDLYQVAEGSGADFGNSFVVAYSTYNPQSGNGQLRYEQFDDAGDAISGGVLQRFNDGTHHGLDFGTFYSSENPNANGSPDFLIANRNNSSQTLHVALKSPDMQTTLASRTISDTGPNGEAATSLDKYDYLRPGSGTMDNFGVLSQTFQYVDSFGQTHEEVALEKVNPKTLQVEAKTKFEDVSGSQTGVGLQHLSNGNVLAIYNDGGQSYVKEFNSSLHQVGSAFAVPSDNNGWDNFVAIGNNQFQIDWRQHTTSSSSSPTIDHTAIFQA